MNIRTIREIHKVNESLMQMLGRLPKSTVMVVLVMVLFAGAGTYFLTASKAAGPFATLEAEDGTASVPATLVTDASASGGKAIAFSQPAPAPVPASLGYGVTISASRLIFQMTQTQLDQEMRSVAATGAKWIRFGFTGTEMEGAAGQTNFANTDRLVNAARANNLQILGILDGMPQWVLPAGGDWSTGPKTAAERQAFADFSRRVVQHYSTSVTYWEVWNEPNLAMFWSPAPSTSDYVLMLKQTYAAIKQAAPSSKVILGGTGWPGSSPDIGTMVWYRALYAGGARGSFDATNVHPYPDFNSFPGGELAVATQLRQYMDSQGDTTMELWGTETGSPTGGNASTTEGNQGAILTKTYDYWSAMHDHGPLFWYEYRDQDNVGASTNREAYFGMVHLDGTQKPAYSAFVNWLKAHP